MKAKQLTYAAGIAFGLLCLVWFFVPKRTEDLRFDELAKWALTKRECLMKPLLFSDDAMPDEHIEVRVFQHDHASKGTIKLQRVDETQQTPSAFIALHEMEHDGLMKEAEIMTALKMDVNDPKLRFNQTSVSYKNMVMNKASLLSGAVLHACCDSQDKAIAVIFMEPNAFQIYC